MLGCFGCMRTRLPWPLCHARWEHRLWPGSADAPAPAPSGRVQMLGSTVHLAVTQNTFRLQCRGCMGERMPSLFCRHLRVTDDVSSGQVMRAAAELATTRQQHLRVSSGLWRSSGFILHDACVCRDVQRDLSGAWLVFQAWTSSRRAASGASGRASCTTMTTTFGRALWRCRRTTSGAEVHGVRFWCPLLKCET